MRWKGGLRQAVWDALLELLAHACQILCEVCSRLALRLRDLREAPHGSEPSVKLALDRPAC